MDWISGADPFTSWWLAIAVTLIVTVVVAVLLRMIISTARDIDATAAEIWARGQRVANNTIHIAALYQTRDVAGRILGRAGQIAGHAEAITDHAQHCPGCPKCFLGGE